MEREQLEQESGRVVSEEEFEKRASMERGVLDKLNAIVLARDIFEKKDWKGKVVKLLDKINANPLAREANQDRETLIELTSLFCSLGRRKDAEEVLFMYSSKFFGS